MQVLGAPGHRTVRFGKPFATKYAQQVFGQQRSTLDSAFPGAVIGLMNATALRVGDTLHAGKPAVRFPGLPSFAPAHFAVARPAGSQPLQAVPQGIEQLESAGWCRCPRRSEGLEKLRITFNTLDDMLTEWQAITPPASDSAEVGPIIQGGRRVAEAMRDAESALLRAERESTLRFIESAANPSPNSPMRWVPETIGTSRATYPRKCGDLGHRRSFERQ